MSGEPARTGRVAALDGLRGCAILLVIAAHAASPQVQSLGAGGVTVFFVLSGYLITTILLRHRAAGGSVGLRGFYLRRARRLLPALVVLLVFEASVRLSTGQSIVPVLLAGGYLTNVAAAAGSASTLDHTWSLALEEQFYLLWPLVIPLLWRRRGAVALVLALAAASAVARAVLYAAGLGNVAWFSARSPEPTRSSSAAHWPLPAPGVGRLPPERRGRARPSVVLRGRRDEPRSCGRAGRRRCG